MSRHSKGGRGIPDRWLDYTSVGRRLSGTRFIAFKVPLKQALNSQLCDSDMFGPWDLLEMLHKDKQELGLIIDLTYTTRYYNLMEVPKSLLTVKIFTRGHEIPSDETILKFKQVVRSFLRDNVDNDKLIGVHCTHGLNRTGYLICRYLIDVDRMDPKEAVKLFNSSRGHDIERQNYLEDLQSGPKRSNHGMDECDLEIKIGNATHRPVAEERHPPADNSWYHRSAPLRGPDHHSHHRPPFLLPAPPVPPRMMAPPHPYQPPRFPNNHWRGKPHREDHRFRRTPPQDHRFRRAPPQDHRFRRTPPQPPSRPRFPLYRPQWTNQPNSSYRPEEEWAGPNNRHQHGLNGYNRYTN